MFSDIFSFVDDTLIDEYFQPACDRIRNKFGWTKSLPTAVALIIAIVGLAPLTTAACSPRSMHCSRPMMHTATCSRSPLSAVPISIT